MSSVLLSFYLGTGKDSAGRTFQEILWRDDDWLEKNCDYIQWLFPLEVPSDFNPQAPILNQSLIWKFRSNPDVQTRLILAFERMLNFYGLVLCGRGSTAKVNRSETFDIKSPRWLKPNNHNFLRLTRIMKCLYILGLEDYAKALFNQLKTVYEEKPKLVGEVTWKFWQYAVQNS
jgi:hypothetical protein